jgi:large subunit ribosomal protein L17
MRHRKKLNHLGRTSSHRKAMLANMASSLILHKRITTTVAKAKALRIYVEPLITKSKNDSTHSRRIVFSYLKNKYAVSELFREVSPKIAERPGGYTRILKTGARLGDNADMCIIELVDYNENMLAAQAEAKTPSKRARRGRGKKTTDATDARQQKPGTSDAAKTVVAGAAAGAEPAKDKDASAEAEDKPAQEEAKSAEKEAKPAEKEAKPAEKEAKSAEKEAKSAEKEAKPAEEKTKPAQEETSGDREKEQPADDKGSSDDNDAEPSKDKDSASEPDEAKS